MIDQREMQVPGQVMAPVNPNTSLPKLDLGCGNNKAEGYIGVDICKTDAADVVHDLTKAPWPFEDNSIGEARACHFFEHLTPSERITFMNELHRILRPGAGCLFVTPRGFDRQVQDFTHQWPPVVEATYLYFDPEWMKANRLDHYLTRFGITTNFEVRALNVSLTQEFLGKHDDHKLFAGRHYLNAAVDLTMLVVKRP